MARRIIQSPEAESGTSTRVNVVKKEKPSGISKGKGKARAEPDPEQDGTEGSSNEDAEGEEDDTSGSPHGNKRARLNDEGESLSTTGTQPKVAPRMVTLPRDVDGFIPGSIVRIQLQNFVTYDYVEFCPGPYLNLILGPNGTGKSSIACAICLGLNQPPSILGRASELNSFVKLGTQSGYIEIELKGAKGKPNLVIRRNLTAASKGSTFTLNGQPATGREINVKMAELNVQVANLCSFLPQDKVSEFAAMSPQQLLKETQRAAGDERLSEWHQTLINAGKELKEMNQSIKEESDHLRQMQERNEGIERDVQRYHERKAIERQIELLGVLIPVEEYRELRVKFVAAKATQRKFHEKVKRLKEKNEPAHNLLQKLETQLKEHDKKRELLKKTTLNKFTKISNKWKSTEKLEVEADKVTARIDALKNAEKDRAKKIKQLEGELARMEAELAKPLQLEDEGDLANEARKISEERSTIHSKMQAIDDQVTFQIDQKARSELRRKSAEDELKKLDDDNELKMRRLLQWDKDTHDAVLWLRAHRNLFRMEVFDPPSLCLTVPNKAYASAVEACFSGVQLRTFVAQCQEDLDTFNHHVNDGGALGRKARVPTWFRVGEDAGNPPLSPDEMQSLGFDGYAVDFVNCPPGMHWFLRKELNLHRTAIGLNPNKIDGNLAMQAIGRTGGATFISGKVLNIVSRSNYGRRAIGNITRDIRDADKLVAAIADPEFKSKKTSILREETQQIQLFTDEIQRLADEHKGFKTKDEGLQREQTAIQGRRHDIKQAQSKRTALKAKRDRGELTLKAKLNEPSVDNERAELNSKLVDISKQRIIVAKEYTALARSIISEQMEATEMGLRYLQAGANRTALQALCDKKDEKYQTALAEYKQADDRFRGIKTDTKRALEHSRDVVANATPELREDHHRIGNCRTQWENLVEEAKTAGVEPPPPGPDVDLRTLNELKEELDTQRAKLELNLATNPGVIEQYEKRKKDIEQLEKTLAERRKKVEKVERNIKNARDNWQPALEKLVKSIGEKFSAAFDRIGCAGEIRISQHEDYDKWAIDILVKFRDSEKLQLLTGQRQSGGERSLTTILYLMSLTEEARAPFSLVDEINQGMDQRAERMVHNSMVEVTCKPDSAQYFLITPKLLSDLEYHERMKVLCVNNGEWLPEERGLGNMMNMIEGFVQQKRGGVNSN